jgi:Protein of unknown function (DUF3987)
MKFTKMLANERVFILARLQPKVDGTGTAKIPTCPLTGNNIDAHDPAQWLTGEEVEAYITLWNAAKHPGVTEYGPGLVISQGSGYWCVDLDKCRDGNGWQPHAVAFIQQFPGAYVESSQSYQGLHVAARSRDIPRHGTRNADYHMECYSKLRFIYLTGYGAYGDPRTDLTEQFRAFVTQYFPAKDHGAAEWSSEPVPQWRGPADDDELIERMLRSKRVKAMMGHAASFAQLWAGGDVIARYYRGDASAADQGLANQLAWWTGNDCERMLTLMKRSGLARDKYERPDYLPRTIMRACADQREWYCERAPAADVPVGTPSPPPPSGETESWPEPESLFEDMKARAFDGSELPSELSEYPMLEAQQTGFDPGIGLHAALAVASMAITDQIQVCANSSTQWFEQARLWALIIAPPGVGKTPGQKPMIKPLWAIHTREHAEWEIALEAWEAEDESTRGPKPPQPRVLLTDVTIARLSDVLAENPRGIGLVVDEFSSWFGSLDMQAGGSAGGHDRGEALMLFEGGTHQIERVTRGSIYVPNWSTGILSGSTPAQMRIYAKHLPEDGLIQRFLVYLARDKVTVGALDQHHTHALAQARARYSQTIERLWVLQPYTHSGVVPMDAQACEFFETWRASVDEHVKAYRELEPPLAGHVAKYATFALRIALVFHCVKVVNGAPQFNGLYDVAAVPMDVATIRQATEFLERSSSHAKSMYMELSGSAGSIGVARDVARYILVHKAPENVLARRDILNHVHAYKKADEGTQAAAMRFLEEMGWVRPTDGAQRRATGPTRFAVNPAIAKTFASLAASERARRALARELIGKAAQARREGM